MTGSTKSQRKIIPATNASSMNSSINNTEFSMTRDSHNTTTGSSSTNHKSLNYPNVPEKHEKTTIENSITPNILTEGDNITSICTGNVGKPPGRFSWKKFRNGENLPTNYTHIITTTMKGPDMCTYIGTSYLTIQVTAEDNQAIIRCVADSSLENQDIYEETTPIEVRTRHFDFTIEYGSTFTTTSSSTDDTSIVAASHVGFTILAVIVCLSFVLLMAYGFRFYNRSQLRRRKLLNIGKKKANDLQLSALFPLRLGHYEHNYLNDVINIEALEGNNINVGNFRIDNRTIILKYEISKKKKHTHLV
ncbi:uncharacterized protein LOC127706999 [Mytilus californianus]|uniref:uncharacterized protein LOC127706999 n=1 Tax=Mytilus californianus TaxID=6549 RepID=UPI002247DD58|nr:uncharacterized protein LOC127706999 [Mytilus californianus]XP_052067723.1 uncharacterized protein LOC127706999 [Mytilus californianus]